MAVALGRIWRLPITKKLPWTTSSGLHARLLAANDQLQEQSQRMKKKSLSRPELTPERRQWLWTTLDQSKTCSRQSTSSTRLLLMVEMILLSSPWIQENRLTLHLISTRLEKSSKTAEDFLAASKTTFVRQKKIRKIMIKMILFSNLISIKINFCF